MIYVVAHNSLNFSPHDDWADSVGVALAIQVKENRITLADLLVPYNGHPLLIWRLVTVAHTLLFNYDVRVEQWLTVLLFCLNFGLLGKLLWQGLGRAMPLLYWLGMVLIGLLLFTPRHTYNWLWGISLIWASSVSCFLLGLWLIRSVQLPMRRLYGLLVLSTIAFLTHGIGAAIWIAWLPAAWLRGERSRRFWWAYGTLTILFLLARLTLGEGVEARARVAVEGFSISRVFIYFGILLGNLIILPEGIMVALGVLAAALLALSILTLLQLGAPPREVGVIASVGAFAVLAAVMISVARHDIVPLLISSSLYLVHTQLIWIALVFSGLWIIYLQAKKRASRLARYPALIGTSALASLLGIAFVFHLQLYETSFQKEFDCLWRYALNGTIACTAGFVPNFSQKAVPRLEGMLKHRLGAFNQAPQRAFQVSPAAYLRIPDLPYRYTLQICTKPTCSKGVYLRVSAIEATTDASAERPAQAELDLSAWRGERPCLAYLLGLWRKVFGHP
jgi:hypothetical protein